MKQITACLSVILFFAVLSCQRKPATRTLNAIESAFEQGQLTNVAQWADSVLQNGKTDSLNTAKLVHLKDMALRIRSDFTLTESAIQARLAKEFGDKIQSDKEVWEKNNWLEFRIIDGEKRYFKRAVSNLKLILKSKQNEIQETDSFHLFRLMHARKVIAAASDGKPVIPVKIKLTYRLSVDADAVPDGEIVRCWLPYPREIHNRQREVTLLNTIPENHFIAPDTVTQRSVYLEQRASKGKPVVFEMQISYLSLAQYFDLSQSKILSYDTTSVNYKKYTAEQYPQIVFSKEIKQLSDSIVEGETDPAAIVRKLYYWINDHIIWTGALEYSIIPQIPEYVLKNRRGDCGMQVLLFMSMARYQGIPVKWQSGFMMHPGEVNLHDWCEVYYEGPGWVPLDMSFHLQNSDDRREKEYYVSGIDVYRLIVNDAISSQFVPEKRFARSEPYDFQRGEVEWRGGNLYFNQWDYHMEVDYQNQ